MHEVFDINADFAEKSEEESQEYRKAGNELFKEKRFWEALEKFNQSLMYAPVQTKAKINGTRQTDNGANNTPITNGTTSMNGKIETSLVANAGNVNMAYVLANRSAALFYLKLYGESVKDIDSAFSLGYPEELAYKLHERKGKSFVQLGRAEEAAKCFEKAAACVSRSKLDTNARDNLLQSLDKQKKKLIRQISVASQNGNDKDCNTSNNGMTANSNNCDNCFKARSVMEEFPQLNGETSKTFGCTIAGFQHAQSEDKGRYIVAGRDIPIGDVISGESPYCSVLYSEYYLTHCNNCLVRFIQAVPCRQCSRVAYCSPSCEAQAWEGFHKTECPCLRWLGSDWVGRLGHLALRLVSVAGYLNLKKYYSTDPNQSDPDRGQSFKNTSPFNADGTYSKEYDAIFNLVANEESRTPENLFNFSLISVILMKIYFECTRIMLLESAHSQGDSEMIATLEHQLSPAEKKIGPHPKQLLMLGSALMHHLEIIQCNGVAINEMQGTGDFSTFEPRDIGLGIYPVHGLLNHSCNPNIDLCFYGNKMVARAISNIQKGEEICLDYGVTYFTHPKATRAQILKLQYYFDCNCEACVNDWPHWQNIDSVLPIFRCTNLKCRLPLLETQGQLPTHVVCQCGLETPVLKNVNELNVSKQRLESLGNPKSNSEEELPLKALLEHASLMQKYICLPWKDFVGCQSTITQNFRLMGNWYRVNEVPRGCAVAMPTNDRPLV